MLGGKRRENAGGEEKRKAEEHNKEKMHRKKRSHKLCMQPYEVILNENSNQLKYLKSPQTEVSVFYLLELFFSSKKKAGKVTY